MFISGAFFWSPLAYFIEKLHATCTYEAFLKAFERLPDQLPEFTLKTWHGLVDYVTVYAEDDIRFTFKNGQEVKA